MKVYKIRDRKSKMFSTGTLSPRWNKVGKAWNKSSLLQTHLRQIAGIRHKKHPYTNAEIVEIEISEVETHSEDALSKIHDLLAEDFDKKTESKKQLLYPKAFKRQKPGWMNGMPKNYKAKWNQEI